MRQIAALSLAFVAVSTVSIHLSAAGSLGIFGIIERVVFEPNEKSPTRVQVWGAFAYGNGGIERDTGASMARRGYLYFQLPVVSPDTTQADIDRIVKEWNDIKAVAGSDQIVAFGAWSYSEQFSALQPDVRPRAGIISLPQSGSAQNLRVRPSGEIPTDPAVYHANPGVLKIAPEGNHLSLARSLRETLRR